MISLKYLIFLGLISALFIAGCVSPPGVLNQQNNTAHPETTCRMVTSQEPQLTEECGTVSYTEPVCGLRKLPYEKIKLPLIHICSADGPCAGELLSTCTVGCQKAMTRCMMTIRNLDTKKSGEWTVGANYTVTGGMFLKDPITISIGPNETGTFDFNQFYAPGSPINSATCAIFVVSEPSIEDCVQETRTRTDCKNTTKMIPIQKQVCD